MLIPKCLSIIWLGLALCAGSALAQPGGTSTRLRDELMQHFSQDNLVPVFLPRSQEVGDVLDVRGAVYARRADCFPGLVLSKPRPGNTLQEVSISLETEGNFGLGLKQLVSVFASGRASAATRLSIVFTDQHYVSASTMELKNTYSKAKCPFLAAIVEGKAIDVGSVKKPLLVLQEVFYAKKKLAIDVGKDADVGAEFEKVKGALALGPSAHLGVKHTSGNQILVESTQSVPVAARLAFLPTAITGTTLGTGGSPAVRKVLWQQASTNPALDAKGMTLIYKEVYNATAGEQNPLLTDD